MPGASASEVMSQDGHDDQASNGLLGVKSAPSVTGSMASSTYVMSLPGFELDDMAPVHVNTNRELEDIFDAMVESFEGRETEHNWMAREANVNKIRALLRGNAFSDYQMTFLTKVKSLLDGILKALNSLRTSLSTVGGQCIKDLAIIAGPGIDNMVEILLVNLVKQCANTKKLTSKLGNLVVSTILAHVSYHPKLLQHVWNACEDKNVQPRSYAAGWIAVLLETHIDHKAHIEHTGGVEVLVKCIKRGLADANPGVRESMRVTYWKFAAIWPEPAQLIMDGLDNTSKKLLEKTNPNKSAAATGASNSRAPVGRAATAPAPARPSIRDAILAQKRSKGNLKAQQMTANEVATRALSPPPPPASGPSGLSSAPVRRPGMKTRTQHISDTAQRPIRSASPTLGSRASPMPESRSNEPPPRSPPVSRTTRGVTPMRAQSPLISSPRKLTVLEQLNSPDWKVRVEGIVVVACILAKRTPPDYGGGKMPTLPPSDVFAPTLAKLFNDPQPEVVEHLVAPEVLAELAKVVPMEQIIPKVLLLSEGDDEQHAQPINASTMPALKKLMTDNEAADLLFKVIQSMSSSGVLTRKISPGTFTPTQKRKITHGCLLWMNELVEGFAGGRQNEFFNDKSHFKLILNRFIQMFSTIKPPNVTTLATLLKNLKQLDEEAWNKTLSTFEPAIGKELRKIWGVNVEEDTEAIVVPEEKVAHVAEVLGAVPEVGGIMAPSGTEDIAMPPAPRPVTPPPLSVLDNDSLKNLPALPRSPEGASGILDATNFSPRRRDENPAIKVYQDPIVESNGAVATSTIERSTSTLSADKRWQNYKASKNASLSKTPGDSSRLLQTLVQRLQTRDMDTQAFRKLIGIARENSVREPLAEANGDSVQDIWQGGSVFRELLAALLEYIVAEDIESPKAADLRMQGLLVLKQLLAKAAPYFARHEADVLPTLINLRGKYPTHPQITTAIEEIAEEYMVLADPKAGIDIILDMNLPFNEPEYRPPVQSWCMSLTCLAALVRSSRPSALEPLYARLGKLAIKVYFLLSSPAWPSSVADASIVPRRRRPGGPSLLRDYVHRDAQQAQ
jgi:CLIP-associating protein 1/2